MTPREDRILDAFEPGIWLTQAQVLKAARMDTATCIQTARRLVDRGLLEMAQLERAGIRGRRSYIYRLAMRNKEAA